MSRIREGIKQKCVYCVRSARNKCGCAWGRLRKIMAQNLGDR